MSIDWSKLSRRDWFTLYCLQQRGLQYRWRGDDPLEGEDCSGFVIFNGQTPPVYLWPKEYDNTAAGIYAELHGKGLSSPDLIDKPGAFVFWASVNDPAKIYHIEVCLGNRLSIGAASGDHTTVDLETAERQGAYVKVRSCGPRGAVQFFADPFAGQC